MQETGFCSSFLVCARNTLRILSIYCVERRGTDNNWRGGQDGNGKTEQEDAGLESAGRKNP